MGKVIILDETTQCPITLMGQRAGVCWGGDTQDKIKNYKRGLECLHSGHGRVYKSELLNSYVGRIYAIIVADDKKTYMLLFEKYIKWNIQHLYYVELCLDEFYVTERNNYQKKHYPHYNLFYGFDDQLKVYYIMGYGRNSTPVVSQISYDAFKQNLIMSEKVIRYRYHGNEVRTLEFNLQSIKTGLYEFVHDINSSEKMCNILTEEEVSYGVSILKKLATTEVGREHLLRDKRVSFCLKEHCRMMGERLEYLYKNKYLRKKYYIQLKQIYDQMHNLASILLNLVLKNKYKPIEKEKIYSTLMRLYEVEIIFCDDLLDYITEENFR